MKYCALNGTKVIFDIILYKPASLIRLFTGEERSKFQTKYGFELTPSDLICLVISVESLVKF
jgi:hypothetical protein